MTQLPNDYILFLKAIQKLGYPTAIIGGGAVRDAYNNKPIKDVDIFIGPMDVTYKNNKHGINFFDVDFCLSNKKEIENILSLNPKNGDVFCLSRQTPIPLNDSEDYYEDNYENNVCVVWDIVKNKINYQIIAINTNPKKYLTTNVDFGICMCYHDGISSFFSEEFLNDVNNKTITLCGKLDGKHVVLALAKHLPRLKQKYPEFKLMIEPTRIVEKFLESKNKK